jgi:hypothetical protein
MDDGTPGPKVLGRKEGSVKRGLLVIPAVALALLLSAVNAAASEWCSDDPTIHFRDGGGHIQTVYLTTYGDGLEHVHAVRAQAYSFGTEVGDHGHKTKVKLTVFVPDDSRHHFHVRWVVSTGPGGTGIVLARHEGDSGHNSDLEFEVSS